MQKIGLVAAVVLLCSVTLAPAFSDDDYQEKESKFDMGGYSNQTLSVGGYSNKTVEFEDSNGTDIGHEISDYVHKRNDLEKEQRDNILAMQKDCRNLAKESGDKTSMHQCIDTIKSLRMQYRSFVSEQNTQFQQFRQGVIVGNHTIQTPQQNALALDNIVSEVSHQNPHAFHGAGDMNGNNRHH